MSDETECWNCGDPVTECECGDLETYSNHSADCPYCGNKNLAWHSDGLLYNESIESYECGHCGKEFAVAACCNWTWISRKKG